MKSVRLKVLLASCLVMLGCNEESNGIQLGSCKDSAGCPNGLSCVEGLCKRPVEAGGSCASSDSFCISGTCENGVCTGGESNIACDNETNPCPSGLVCTPNGCVKPAEVGASCTSNAGCKQGKCVNGACSITVMPGQSCDDTRLCGEGYKCHDGICLKPVDLNEDCRSSLVFCENGSCSQGVCVTGSSSSSDCQDTDGDTISDEYDNCTDDTDGDTLVNCLDLDSDGDTIPDALEAGADPCKEPMNSDMDFTDAGTPMYDFLDLDSDNNGIPDSIEGIRQVVKVPEATDDNPNPSAIVVYEYVDTDGDGILDSSDEDNDGDGSWDIIEIPGYAHPDYKNMGASSPRAADCDGDTLPDEVGSIEHPFDCDNDTIPDYLDSDSDNDGILDFYEFEADSDNDGYYDRYEQDSDNDGLTDTEELGPDGKPMISIAASGYDFQNPDIDDDGLPDGNEPLCTITLQCEATEAACAQKCIDIMSDANNCGGCGITCLSTSACVEGVCVAQCTEPEVACGESCVDLTADAKNCGACGTVCATNQVCSAEGCVDVTELTCEDGKTGCWGTCQDLQNDANNCGTCGNVCDSGLSCVEGACVLVCADAALTPCANTACVNLTTDAQNCGACGTVCATNQVCSAEGCVDVTELTCEDGKTGCWGTCQDLQNDAKNCGTCGNICPADHACEDGVCHSTKQPDNIVNIDARLVGDADGDGYGDNSEFIAATYMGVDPAVYICDSAYGVVGNPETGVEGAFNFYFELPYEGEEKRDTLNFKPSVSKLDVIFNVDTTNSMGVEVQNLKDKISDTIIPQIRQRVTDSAIGVSRFDDFPTRATRNSEYDYLVGNSIEDGYGKENIIKSIVLTSKDECKDHDSDIAEIINCEACISDCDDYKNCISNCGGRCISLLENHYMREINTSSEKICQIITIDTPFKLLGQPETDDDAIKYNVEKLGLHHGADFPESGYEALWQLVMGDDRTKPQAYWRKYASYSVFSGGAIEYTTPGTGRWGGGKFRDASLPVVVHITDTTSHDDACNCPADTTLSEATLAAFCGGKNTTCKPYDPIYVTNAHYSKDVHKAYQDKGARVISVYRQDGTQLQQLVDTSKATQAIVPMCAFQTETGWKCGENKCCTSNKSGTAVGVAPVDGMCVLSYGIASGNDLSTTLVDGVDALVKYATADVAAVVRGEPIDGSEYDTSCFVKGVVAFNDVDESGNKVTNKNGEEITGYVAPPQEPEASCNPTAQPMAFDGATYNNGYSNFAIGTSSASKAGAQLNFIVKAQNDVCAKPKEQAQVFQAYIDVIDPKTGMVFGTQQVSIVVPGEKAGQIN